MVFLNYKNAIDLDKGILVLNEQVINLTNEQIEQLNIYKSNVAFMWDSIVNCSFAVMRYRQDGTGKRFPQSYEFFALIFNCVYSQVVACFEKGYLRLDQCSIIEKVVEELHNHLSR